jgi:N-acetylmuramoyl-L-alanine amidase
LAGQPAKQKYRHNWMSCIQKSQKVTAIDPSGPWAPAGLYLTAQLYWDLYGHSYRNSDRQEAIDLYNRIINRYPRSAYRQRARKALSSIRVADRGPAKAPVPSKSQRVPKTYTAPPDDSAEMKAGTERCLITGLRYWSNPRYTRVVVDASAETSYAHRLLKKDPTIGKPQRLYIDFDNSRLKSDVKREIPINDNLLIDTRAGQYTPESVRVVVDIKSFDNYKIFSLKNPFRVVIDVWGARDAGAAPSAQPPVKSGDLPSSALAKQFALGVRRIVIDPGHGGKDFGAPGYIKGVHEKDIVLQIGKRLARKIRSELGCEVIMTRDRDRYLTLEERTAIANTQNADLFISIHTNAARGKSAYGIETFFLNLATDDEAIMVAARENATSRKNISDLETILTDLMQNTKINESSRLAVNVQTSLYQHLKPRYQHIKSKGVKQAPFYVLLGAEMPAILVETSFISNPRECRRLTDPAYQDHLSDGIIRGIRSYIREISPTADLGRPAAVSGEG